MDNIKEIDQDALNKYFGLDTTNFTDASGSKKMVKDTGASTITYTYTRGGVELKGVINYATQQTTWSCTGIDTSNTNRQDAIAEGLKVEKAKITFT